MKIIKTISFIGIITILFGCRATAEQDNVKPTDMQTKTIHLTAGERHFTINLYDNSSTKALVDLLSDGPVTIDMEDYAGMEKVGQLPVSLPQNNRQMNTGAGDVILYQGRNFVVYYGNNSWSLTPIGKIEGATRELLLEAFGQGDVKITLSL